MVESEVITRRMLVLNECLQELSRPLAGAAQSLAADTLLRAAVERWLQVAIEACSDIAFHVVASEGWTPPETGRAAFATLAAHGKLDPDLARRLGRAVGLRNVLVHDYVTVNLELVARIVREDLGDLRLFAKQAASWIDVAPAPV